ncbi:MAG: hypothetical protein BMS9Abin05_0464 [Rhodothermia bacterium]|nr:MAG: hypothetical protein BMS9Abin05_0464 [Rhodothermia bacterium]
MAEQTQSRRTFLSMFAGGTISSFYAMVPKRFRKAEPHPDPRPGIDASKVMTREQLDGWSENLMEIFDKIREIPEIADGIGCNCGCAVRPNYRSLLTCFYSDGMARGCAICQGEAKLVYGRFKEGQSLEQIRRAIDARFG